MKKKKKESCLCKGLVVRMWVSKVPASLYNPLPSSVAWTCQYDGTALP